MSLVLHDYWRSSAAYRVRIALNLKGLDYLHRPHDLRQGEHRRPDYLALAPQGLVPALEADDVVLTQSPAILEWLEERHPAPPLLPSDPGGRAVVRAMAALIGCDIHPINNLRVLKALRETFGADEAAVQGWIARWIEEGFAALEVLIGRHGGQFAYGDTPGLADCYLVPQVYSAQRFGVDLGRFGNLIRAYDNAASLPPVQDAHPQRQVDADPA